MMDFYKIKVFLFLLFSLILIQCSGQTDTPKNIILFIGDGMGVSQVSAGKIVKGNLNLEKFRISGLVSTHSSDRLITDSAAAGTALATGFKTYNGAISVTPDKNPVKTSLEYAEAQGMSTGVVSTCTVTHATPASFLAHAESRKMHSEIAEQIAQSGVDVLIGGGWAYFIPQNSEGSKRQDDLNLFEQMQDEYEIIKTPAELSGFNGNKKILALLDTVDLVRASERNYTLADLTQNAIKHLSRNQNGFFLMVEGSQIDWAGHDNETEYLLNEMIDFDDAIGVGYDFAARNGETLVVVTADHETGGFAIMGGSLQERAVTGGGFVSGSHTAAMVPLFATGPGSEKFSGIIDNTLVGKQIIELIDN